jgi:hypothetical protein
MAATPAPVRLDICRISDPAGKIAIPNGNVNGDEMDSLLKCLVPRVREFLLLCPIMAGA